MPGDGLLPFARRVVAEREAVPPTPPASADEMAEAVAEAQAQLEQSANAGVMARDPYRLILAGLSATLGVFPKLLRRMENAVAEARHPLSEAERAALRGEIAEAVERGAAAGMRKEAARLVRVADRARAVRIGLAVGGAFVAGAVLMAGVDAIRTNARVQAVQAGLSLPLGAGNTWLDLIRANPDPRPALGAASVRTDPASGRRYYEGISFWADTAGPPPR